MLGTKVMIDWLKKNFISIFMGILFFALAIYSVCKAENSRFPENSTWLGACIFCLCLMQLSRFKKIKGLGMEAELWNDTQKEAKKLTTQLSSLADLVTQGQVLNLNRMGNAYESDIPRKIQWEKFQEMKRQYPLDSLEKASEQFRLIILTWWGKHINNEFCSFDCGNDTIRSERTSLKLEKVKSHNLDLASSFKTEGNLMICTIERNLEKLKTSNSFEKQENGLQKTIEDLKAFVETGEFEHEVWFKELLQKDE